MNWILKIWEIILWKCCDFSVPFLNIFFFIVVLLQYNVTFEDINSRYYLLSDLWIQNHPPQIQTSVCGQVVLITSVVYLPASILIWSLNRFANGNTPANDIQRIYTKLLNLEFPSVFEIPWKKQGDLDDAREITAVWCWNIKKN